MNLPLEVLKKYLTSSEAKDHVWTNQRVVLGAMVLEVCYGSHASRVDGGGDEYGELIRLRDEWGTKGPRSFVPVYAEPPTLDAEPVSIFPVVWYADDTHMNTTQILCVLDIFFFGIFPFYPLTGPVAAANSRRR
ncbi:hypothetical protein BDW68DRAFT_174648 [Aspergillus falconensis]